MENNHYENPKMAIIRLLKSQGCCQEQPTGPDPHYLQMVKYREQLSLQTARERNKLSQIPCAITLAQQVTELKEVINGLGRQNSGRINQLGKIQEKVSGQ